MAPDYSEQASPQPRSAFPTPQRRAAVRRTRVIRTWSTSSATTTCTPVQPRREVHVLPTGAAGAQFGLDWMVFTEHSNFGHAEYGRRAGARGDPQGPGREPAPADLPGPGVVHPGRRALHGLRRARPARGRPAARVRARLRRQAARLHRGRPDHPDTPRNEAHAVKAHPVAGRAEPHRATSTTSWSSPTTRCAWASTPRTRCAAGGTPAPEIMIGMEGAPGAQGARHPRLVARGRPRDARRVREQASAQSWPGYPADAYLHVRRLRLGDRDRRRAVGLDAGRGHGCSRSPRTPTTTGPSATPGSNGDWPAGRELRQHRQAARPGEHRHAAAGQRLLARPVQPHPRRRHPLRLPRR